jgi:hypothetical protein
MKHIGLISDQMKRGYVIVKNFFAKSNYFNLEEGTMDAIDFNNGITYN